jgi:hypothetical protein
VLIDYSDNGKGCEKSTNCKKWSSKYGKPYFCLIKELLLLTLNPNKGFKVKITMPK